MAKHKFWEAKIPDKAAQNAAKNKKRSKIGLAPISDIDPATQSDQTVIVTKSNNYHWFINNAPPLQPFHQTVTQQLANQHLQQLANRHATRLIVTQKISLDIHHFEPDPNYPNTIGWRCWNWLIDSQKLISPVRNTVWTDAELRCDHWNESESIRGVAGIHARIVPINWEKEFCPEGTGGAFVNIGTFGKYIQIDGLVERFGKYVLGTEGWRTEWAIIRKLKAPTTEIGLQLEKAFPDVEIIYEQSKSKCKHCRIDKSTNQLNENGYCLNCEAHRKMEN